MLSEAKVMDTAMLVIGAIVMYFSSATNILQNKIDLVILYGDLIILYHIIQELLLMVLLSFQSLLN